MGKAVRHALAHMTQGLAIAIKGYGAKTTIRPKVVYSTDMIIVHVCEQHAIDASERQRH